MARGRAPPAAKFLEILSKQSLYKREVLTGIIRRMNLVRMKEEQGRSEALLKHSFMESIKDENRRFEITSPQQ